MEVEGGNLGIIEPRFGELLAVAGYNKEIDCFFLSTEYRVSGIKRLMMFYLDCLG